MGGTLTNGGQQKRRNIPPPVALCRKGGSGHGRGQGKDQHRPNEEPINETIAGTGPGIPDDALAPGEKLPEPPSDEEVENGRKARRAECREEIHFRWKVNDLRLPNGDSVPVQFCYYLRGCEHSPFPSRAQRVDAARRRPAQRRRGPCRLPPAPQPPCLRPTPARRRRAVDGAAGACRPASRGNRPPAVEQGPSARADRSSAGDRAGRRHDLHRRGAGAARGPQQRLPRRHEYAAWSGAPVDLFTSVNPIYTDLRRGLVKYQQTLGQPAAGPDSGRSDAQGRHRPAIASPRFGTRLGLADGDKLRPRSPPGSRNSRRSTASRPTASPAPGRSRRSTAAPNITSS